MPYRFVTTHLLGGRDLVPRLGYGAMQLAVPGVIGPDRGWTDGGNHPDEVMTAHPGRDKARSQHRNDRRRVIIGESLPPLYQIRVRGRLGQTIRSAFPALRARVDGGDTVLTGVLADQAAVYGVLAEAEALGLELIEVRLLPSDEPQESS
jgi:hypothetical protein